MKGSNVPIWHHAVCLLGFAHQFVHARVRAAKGRVVHVVEKMERRKAYRIVGGGLEAERGRGTGRRENKLRNCPVPVPVPNQ